MELFIAKALAYVGHAFNLSNKKSNCGAGTQGVTKKHQLRNQVYLRC